MRGKCFVKRHVMKQTPIAIVWVRRSISKEIVYCIVVDLPMRVTHSHRPMPASLPYFK